MEFDNVIFCKLVNNYFSTLMVILANVNPIDSPILAAAVCSYILLFEKYLIFCQVSKLIF